MTQPGHHLQRTRPQPSTDLPPGAIPAQRSDAPPVARSGPDTAHHPDTDPGLPRNGCGIAALVFATLGLVFGVVPLTGPLAVLTGLLAVGCGVFGARRVWRGVASNRVMSWVGVALGGSAMLLGVWGVSVTARTAARTAEQLASLTGQGPEIVVPVAPPLLELGRDQVAGEGTFPVGAELRPGSYRTDGPADAAVPTCYWARERDLSGSPSATVASGSVGGPTTVTIGPADAAFTSRGCRPWTRIR